MPKKLPEFKIFSDEATKWIERFGLKEWSISIEEHDLDDGQCIAATVGDLQNRLLQIFYNTKRTVDVTRTEIRRAAFHEVREAILWEVRQMALYSFAFPKVDAAIHRVIILDENVFFN